MSDVTLVDYYYRGGYINLIVQDLKATTNILTSNIALNVLEMIANGFSLI